MREVLFSQAITCILFVPFIFDVFSQPNSVVRNPCFAVQFVKDLKSRENYQQIRLRICISPKIKLVNKVFTLASRSAPDSRSRGFRQLVPQFKKKERGFSAYVVDKKVRE